MLRYLTAGESHGPLISAILEGMPAGLHLDIDEINHQLARRQKGYGSGARMKIERDRVRVTGGISNGLTTGAPISIQIDNLDYAKWSDRDIPPMTIPRPGHADLTAAVKYGYKDLRLSLERASARETAARVAVGAICKQLLSAMKIAVGGYVLQIGQSSVNLSPKMTFTQLIANAESNDLRCPVPEYIDGLHQQIREIMLAKDTLGGIFEIVALGLPPGLGSHVHWDRRLDALLMWSVGSIHAIKGVEIGPAFDNAAKSGSEVHDEIFRDDEGALFRTSNRSGGFEGGITTGEPIVIRAAMTPISTTLNPRRSVDLSSGKPAHTVYERSDFCAVPRAVVVGEAMVAYTIANALLEKLGGDSLDELVSRLSTLRQVHLNDLPMDNETWRFDYKE